MVTMPKNVIIVIMVQLIMLLSNVNVSESQGFFGGILGPIFGFPPSQTPSPSGSGSPTTANRPAGLKAGFYLGLCPTKSVDIEAILKTKIQEEFLKDSTLLPAFLRMQFHDCFVTGSGCDASILIDGTSSEKNAQANLSVRGYELVDTLKAIAEAQCPGIVSCADIIAIVTSEVLRLGGGQGYAVQTGRCDGLSSNMNNVDLPSPSISAFQSNQIFRAKGFSTEEMVVLLGTHTVGNAQCQFWGDRLLITKPGFDPLMNSTLRTELMSTCPQGAASNNRAQLDQNPTSPNTLDNALYGQLMQQRGILPVDQSLARDITTAGIVNTLAGDNASFKSKLSAAMLKLQALNVLTGNKGEIRANCRRFN